MTVYVAFYKGRLKRNASLRERICYLTDWFTRVFTRSPYSHCELAIADEARAGVYFCVSASLRDGGVRGKYMQLPAGRWDLLPCPLPESAVHDELRQHQGQRYDYAGIFRFLLPFLPHSRRRWFCSEFVAAALRLPNPHHHTPKSIHQHLKELYQ